jgi:phosphoenolpyruvate synthase/pyruvate phosphate dikinase
MFETHLGVRAESELLDRVRRCWASQWSERALRGLEAAGIAPEAAGQAVLVQEMVPVVAAGVLLSRDPEGDPRAVLVNAAWGLGEAISQGELPGDLYRVNRSTGEVLARSRGPQRTRVVLDPARPGTVDQPVPPELRDRACLEDDVLRRLAALARRLEGAIGRALDLEFGLHADGSIVVFQVRRVVRTG